MRITQHKSADGIYIDFDSGVQLSTVWGYCNYCENYDVKSGDNGFDRHENGSKDVEVMVFGDEKIVKKICKKFGDGDNPIGYMPVERWLELLEYIRKLNK